MAKLLWTPSKEQIEQANITKFIQFLREKPITTKLKGYKSLYRWSVNNIEDFWEYWWEFAKIIHSESYSKIVENLDKFPPHTKWFPGAKLNFAENLLRYKDDQPAIVFFGEVEGTQQITYQELYQKVARVAKSLSELGVQPGDRVVAYMPNLIETIIAMLAATSLGATWSSCGAELGAKAALDRLGQVKPKILFTVDGYWYKGKSYDQLPKINKVVQGIPSIEKVIILPFVKKTLENQETGKFVSFSDFLSPEKVDSIQFIQLPFEHPLYIMFSSGTTGKPKCMVQSAGGILISHLRELILHTDLKRSDKLLYLTSPSWMMHNWMMSGLAVGATLVLYDGNPLFPDWSTLWKNIQDLGVSIFGCSASYLHYLKGIGARPGTEFDLSKLRQISQTGSALSPEGFQWVYDEIKSDLHYNSISGGTDINGCFAAGSPTLPVYAGELQARALGMKVHAYDDNGVPRYDTQGELVCEAPSPSMPIYFWDDKDNTKYTNTYFNFFEDKHVWRHGDYIQINSGTGGVTFYGRSDAVLKPSGVRIGTSEIYSIVEELDEVADCLAIGQSSKASPRHVPQLIIETPDIPYTFSGKKVESSVTNIIHGRKVTNRGALRNPVSLDFYEEILDQLK
ncbi:MAG: acetoacetate--CoA ligase [Candidatus Kariarchaeaceae archaeon]|jgi:acetoacetyl-CoA synthetase